MNRADRPATLDPTMARLPVARRRLALLGGALVAAAGVATAPMAAHAAAPEGATGKPAAEVAGSGPYAWATADQPSNAGPYNPAAATQFNSTAGNPSAVVTRSAQGVYNVFFPGVHSGGGTGEGSAGTAWVTGIGCKLTGWSPTASGVNVGVACFRMPGLLNQGQPSDATFTVAFTNRSSSASIPVSFLWADQATGSYVPDAAHRFNHGNGTKVTQTATGVYSVKFKSRAAKGIPKVTAYGSGNVLCNLKSWAATGATLTDTTIKVGCFDGTGAPANSRFVVQFGDRNAMFGDSSLNDASISTVSPGEDWSWRSGLGYLASSNWSVIENFPGWYTVTLKQQVPNNHATWNITAVGSGARYCSAGTPTVSPTQISWSVTCNVGTKLKASGFTFQFNAN